MRDSPFGFYSNQLNDMRLENISQRGHRACVATRHADVPLFSLSRGNVKHLVRHCACKQHQKIGGAEILNSAVGLHKYLCAARIFAAQVLVLTSHALITAYYNYAQTISPSLYVSQFFLPNSPKRPLFFS